MLEDVSINENETIDVANRSHPIQTDVRDISVAEDVTNAFNASNPLKNHAHEATVLDGMSLEVLHPGGLSCFHEARVTRVLQHGKVEITFKDCLTRESQLGNLKNGRSKNYEKDFGCSIDNRLDSDSKQYPDNDIENGLWRFNVNENHRKWITNLSDYRLLPTNFCKHYNIPIHPLYVNKIVENSKILATPSLHDQPNATIPLENCLEMFDCAVGECKPKLEINDLMQQCSDQSFIDKSELIILKNEGSPLRHDQCTITNELAVESNQYLNNNIAINSTTTNNEKTVNNLLTSYAITHQQDSVENKSSQTDNILQHKPCTAKMANSCIDPLKIETPSEMPQSHTSTIKEETLTVRNVQSNCPENSLITDTSLAPGSSTVISGEKIRPLSLPPSLDPNAHSISTPVPEPLFTHFPEASALGFSAGQQLETVHPTDEGVICVAAIERITAHLIWINVHSIKNVSNSG